jgi:hypothetical protein
VRHVFDAGFGGAVRGGGDTLGTVSRGVEWGGDREGGRYFVRTMRGHGGSEDDGALDALLYECARGAARRVEGAVQIDAPELVDLLGCEF